ncbi:MAG: hypothetical protein AAF514_14390, partial [Verrucomicrobiota bacterium]
FDLVLKNLYFLEGESDWITVADQRAAEARKQGRTIPLHVHFTAGKKRVVGTSIDYFEFRNLNVADGTLPFQLGDAVLGHQAALDLGLGTGDQLLTDQTSLYDLAAAYPLKLNVTGVLAPGHSPDDEVVFVDVKTAWVIAGIGHGHEDLEKPENENLLLEKDGETLVGSAAVVEFREITPEVLNSFHFHAQEDQLPLTAAILVPDSVKSATLLRGHFSVSRELDLLKPGEVIGSLLAIVLRVKQFFDLSFLLVSVITVLFLILVLLLTLKLRDREWDTLFRMGCSRLTVFWMQAAELAILFFAAVVAATGLALLFTRLLRLWIPFG